MFISKEKTLNECRHAVDVVGSNFIHR